MLNNVSSPAKTILLVEDRDRSRRMHAAALSTHGYDVYSAGNAADAHTVWNDRHVDLVVLAFSCHDAGVLTFLETMTETDPEQRVAFLQDESIYLCPVFHDDHVILRGKGPENFVRRVVALLA